jgi:hypothetical protein
LYAARRIMMRNAQTMGKMGVRLERRSSRARAKGMNDTIGNDEGNFSNQRSLVSIGAMLLVID